MQPPRAQNAGPLQLLDSLDKRAGKGLPDTVTPMPIAFLEEFAQRFETEGLDAIMEPVSESQHSCSPCQFSVMSC